MKRFLVVISLILVVVLTACSSTTGSNAEPVAAQGQTVLQDNYDNALSVQGQLALGIVQLEGTDLAVDEAKAAELLPLWQALTSLTNSDTAAPVEIEAVVKQIEETMSPAQIEAIAAMALTTDSLTDLQSSGGLGFGGFGRGAAATNGDSEATNRGSGGGFPGGPGGDFAGGGFPGGPGGGFGGGAALDEDAISTRQAQFAASGVSVEDRVLLNAVVRLLQTKTGEAPVNGRGNLFETMYTTVSEATGLSIDDIQTAVSGGQTLAQIVTDNGGDVSAVRETIMTALADMPLPEGQDLGTTVDDMLNGTFNNQPAPAPGE